MNILLVGATLSTSNKDIFLYQCFLQRKEVILMNKVALQEKYDLFIGGQWVPSSDGVYSDAHNPATGEKLASFAEAKTWMRQ